MAKKKSKLKKVLKSVAPLLAVAGLGKAYMNARNRKDIINSVTADDGFRLPFTKPNMRDIAGDLFEPKMMTPEDMANDPMFFNAMAKDGGRIKKTKKGGRAVRKANRSKKK